MKYSISLYRTSVFDLYTFFSTTQFLGNVPRFYRLVEFIRNKSAFRYVGIDNFTRMFHYFSMFRIAVQNTFYFMFVTSILKIGLGLIFAVILNNVVKLKNPYRTILFAPIVINPIVTALVFRAVYIIPNTDL